MLPAWAKRPPRSGWTPRIPRRTRGTGQNYVYAPPEHDFFSFYYGTFDRQSSDDVVHNPDKLAGGGEWPVVPDGGRDDGAMLDDVTEQLKEGVQVQGVDLGDR